jgi:hypothetical protein
MPVRKGKAPESILKQPDHAGVTKGTNPSTAGLATLSRTTIAAPTVTLPTVKNTAAADTSGPQYRYSTPIEDLRVGSDSIPLRSIFPLVKGKLMVECILDSGCQIVAMNSVIWEKLGNNLQVERALKMEAANSTITETHGRLHNVRFTFDDIDIYLQVQVMPNAPYDILLGRPFYALTECIMKDFANGDQHLTVTDPNTRQCVTIPTRERKRHR